MWEEPRLVQRRALDLGVEVFVMALKKGRTQLVQCKDRNEAQEYLLGNGTRAGPSLVQS